MPTEPYFLSHSVGCLPKASKQALLDDYCQPWQQQGGDGWPDWLKVIERFKMQLSELLGGQADQFCPQTNLSSGWSKLLTAMAQQSNKRQILMHASAFPSMGFVVQALKPLGLELVLVEGEGSENSLDAWQSKLGDNTLCVLLTHVHSNSGVMTDIAPLAAMCKTHNTLCLVDIAQSVGVVPIDISTWQVDAVLGSCVKWLCGGPGAGFMWLADSLIADLSPMDVGWFSHQNPFEMDIHHFEYADDARRFWGGTPNIASYAIAAASVELINRISVQKIWQHNRQLAAKVLTQLPAHIADKVDLRQNGGTLCLQASPNEIVRASDLLGQAGVHFDKRDRTLRLSLHIYNQDSELDIISSAFT